MPRCNGVDNGEPTHSAGDVDLLLHEETTM